MKPMTQCDSMITHQFHLPLHSFICQTSIPNQFYFPKIANGTEFGLKTKQSSGGFFFFLNAIIRNQTQLEMIIQTLSYNHIPFQEVSFYQYS